MQKILSWINMLLQFIYPKRCLCCDEALLSGEEFVCFHCLYDLPRTNFAQKIDNDLEQQFWGKVKIENAASLFFFEKGGKVQTLLHELKYNGEKDLGVFLGKELGLELKNSPYFNDIDCILPIPLHQNRKKVRGYNQSEMIAKGISFVTNWAIDVTSVFRAVETSTQTKKSNFERWLNVKDIFQLKDEFALENKHVLIVDDVITTGATVEACAIALSKIKGIKISVASIAFA